MTKMNENNNNKNNSNNNAQCRSPYNVLQLRTNATKDEIKASFRKVRKKTLYDVLIDSWFEILTFLYFLVAII